MTTSTVPSGWVILIKKQNCDQDENSRWPASTFLKKEVLKSEDGADLIIVTRDECEKRGVDPDNPLTSMLEAMSETT